jgi:hypothetical protein
MQRQRTLPSLSSAAAVSWASIVGSIIKNPDVENLSALIGFRRLARRG